MEKEYVVILTYDLDDAVPQDYTDLNKELNEIGFQGTVSTPTSTEALTNNTFFKIRKSRKSKKDLKEEIQEVLVYIFIALDLKGKTFILVTPDCSLGLKQHKGEV